MSSTIYQKPNYLLNYLTLPQALPIIDLYASSNTLISSSATKSLNNLIFMGSGAVSVGVSSDGKIIIYGDTVGGGGGIALSAGTQLRSTGTVVFSNSNGITFGMSNSSVVTASFSQSIQTQGSLLIQGSSGSVVFSNSNGITFGFNASTITASHNGLTTARASNDGIGLNTAQTNVTWTVNSAGISLNAGGYAGTGTSATNASITLNSNGLALSVGNYLTTARASNDAVGLNTAGTNITWTVNSSGISINAGGYLTTAAQSNQVVNSINGSTGVFTFNTGSSLSSSRNGNSITFGLASNITTALQSAGAYLTTARASTDGIGLNTAQTNVTWTVNSSGISLNAGGYAGTGTSATNASITLNSNGLAISVAAPGGGGVTPAFSGSNGSFSFSTITFGNLNGMSFYTSNGSAVASYTVPAAQTNQTVGLYAAGNTTQNSSTTLDARTISFNAIGSLTIGYSNGSVQFSAPNALTSQSNQAFSAGAASSAFQTLVFQDSNGISWSNNAGSIRITHDLQYTSNTSAITSNALHTSASRVINLIVATNNTGGGTSSMSSNVSFGNLNGMTFYQSNGSIVASYTDAGAGGGISAIIVSAGGGNTAISNISFADSNGISWGINGSTITASHNGITSQTDQTVGLYALGNTTQNSSTTLDARSVSFNALGGGISVGYSNGSVQLSVLGQETRSSFEPFSAVGRSTAFVGLPTATSAGVSMYPFLLQEYVSAGMLNMAVSAAFLTVGTSSGGQTMGMAMALYTRDVSTLRSVWSQSLSYQVTGNNSSYTVSQVTATDYNGFTYSTTASAGSNISSGYTGMKLLAWPVNLLLEPGQYWLGVIGTNSTSSVNVGLSLSIMGAALATGLSALAPMGSFSSAYTTVNPGALGGRWYTGQGSWKSAGSLTMVPASVQFNSISAVGLTYPLIRFWST